MKQHLDNRWKTEWMDDDRRREMLSFIRPFIR